MQPNVEFLGLCSWQVKCRRSQGGKFRDDSTRGLVHTLSVGVAQLHAGLCCCSATVRHRKRASAFLCWILPYLDHQAASKSTLSHHQVRYYQEESPDEECYSPLEGVL